MSPTAVEIARDLSSLTREDLAWAGAKGATLGELTRAGVPVPPGFVIGAPAFAAWIDGTGMRDRLRDVFAGLEARDRDALADAAGAARRGILEEELPAWLAGAIGEAVDRLSGPDRVPLAVRSSATAEDVARASFAGMSETFLNVRGRAAALHAVRHCWASLFGARTVFDRADRGLPQADVDIAVVLQRYVPASRAGTVVTADPATGRSDRLVVEGAPGPGEAVAPGRAGPDRWVFAKPGLEVVEREPDGQRRGPALSEDEARELAVLGLRIEEHAGAAQDAEWVIDARERVWMLRSGPVASGVGAGE